MSGFLDALLGIAKIFLVIFFSLYAIAIVGGVFCKILIILNRAVAFPALLGMTILPSLAHWFFEHQPGIAVILLGIKDPEAEPVEVPEKGIFRIAQDLGGMAATCGIAYGAFVWTQRGFEVMWAEVSWWGLIVCVVGVRLIPVWGKKDAALRAKHGEAYRPWGVFGVVDRIDRMELPKLFDKITG